MVSYQEICNWEYRDIPKEQQNSVQLGTFSSIQESTIQLLNYFGTQIQLLCKLPGLAKEEEMDVQLKIISWDRLTGTPCDILSS